jgi:myo-inositol-1(or 4)-monophosphatase
MSGARVSQATLSAAQLLDVAIEAAEAGAVVVRAADVSRLEWIEKATADFVTEVDRESERAITACIRRHLPDAAVMGEELSPISPVPDGITFIVDPIDGTTNFLHGYPEYAVSVGVSRAGQLLAGVILNIPANEMYTAFSGGGAFRNGQPISVSHTAEPGRALVGTGFPFKHREQLPLYLRQMDRVIQASAGVRRAGSAALDLASVACGQFDAFWELMLSPWDVAAGIVIVREAGGVVTDLQGSPSLAAHAPVVAGNPRMHRWLLDLLAADAAP